MKNFKPGQKVVFRNMGVTNHDCILPKDEEIVTISRDRGVYKNSWHIVEYPRSKNRNIQYIHEIHLFPIQPITLYAHEIKLEPKKVIESQPIHAQ